jgi:hypothetical protein
MDRVAASLVGSADIGGADADFVLGGLLLDYFDDGHPVS